MRQPGPQPLPTGASAPLTGGWPRLPPPPGYATDSISLYKQGGKRRARTNKCRQAAFVSEFLSRRARLSLIKNDCSGPHVNYDGSKIVIISYGPMSSMSCSVRHEFNSKICFKKLRLISSSATSFSISFGYASTKFVAQTLISSVLSFFKWRRKLNISLSLL